MKNNKAPKGTFDILPSNAKTNSNTSPITNAPLWHYLERCIGKVSSLYGFNEIRTPIFEAVSVFDRTAGDSSDVVQKEMYTFKDKGEREMALRPEGTASVARAAIEHSLLHQKGPWRYMYMGPYFRYDRPQAGRYRQFHQFGAEIYGVDSPSADAELIAFAMDIVRSLGINDASLKIHTLGSAPERKKFIQALRLFLEEEKEHLSEESKKRLDSNPLRILDSKSKIDQEITKKGPQLLSYISQEDASYFKEVLSYLDDFNIQYTIDHSLVRGLDYYSHTVFEIHSPSLGAQSSLGGGGRYDDLFTLLGSKKHPATGFALGMERLLLCMDKSKALKQQIDYVLIPLENSAKRYCHAIAKELRNAEKSCLCLEPTKLNKALEKADQVGAHNSLIVGEEEMSKKAVTIRAMDTSKTEMLSVDHFMQRYTIK